VAICARCGQENPPGFRFCGACGSPLAAEAGADREERKIVTVLFADLVDFTSRAERLDPEDVRAMLTPYYTRLRSELERFGGTVEKFIGDAVVALFGAPLAHEDDPERAVRAALAIRDAIGEMNDSDPELDLHVRVAVNTGEALVSLTARPGEGEGMAAGDVVNTAARLQSAAPTDGILVGEPTYRATAQAIEYREAAPVKAKGKSAPVAAWEAVEARSRLGVDVARAARTPLVGREREVALLRDTLARARDERSPQLVTLVGEPGIGKSRLVYELLRVVEADPDLIYWRQGRCLPYGDGVSFWALAEMVKAQAGILETDPDDQAGAKLHRSVVDLVPEAEDAAWVERHLRPLVGLAHAEELREDRQEEAFAAWRRLIESLADQDPAVLVFEDLHWADEGLLDFIDHLVDWAGGVSLLVVCTARPELLARRPGWGGGKPNASTLSLSPLSEEQTARLIAHLVERTVLPADVQTALLSRAGGNPLYAEEFARMAADRGLRGDPEELRLPESLQGIIAARLDGLPPELKSLIQDAAVLGKVFWLGAVVSIGGVERRDVEQRLRNLEQRQFVRRDRRSSVAGETEYAFWHLLVRDVAYGQIPRGLRAQKHSLAAEWMASLAADRIEDLAEMLAHHYLAALEFARAAGQDTSALEVPARLALRAAGDRALALNSFGAAGRYFGEAAALWPADDPERPKILYRHARALWLYQESAKEALTAALDDLLESGEVELAAEAAAMLGDTFWREGQRDTAFRHFDRARDLVTRTGPSPSKAWVLSLHSRLLMLAGRNDEAIELGRETLAMADSLGLSDIRAHALNNIGTARTAKGDLGGLTDLQASIATAEEANAQRDVARGYINLSSMTLLLGELRRSREMHDRGMEVSERHGLGGQRRWLQGSFPVLLYHAGKWNEALRAADDFIAEAEFGSPHYQEMESRDVRASIRLARDDVEGALDDSAKALAMARGAKDPQALHPSLGERARILFLVGDRPEALAIAEELVGIVSTSGIDLTAAYWFVSAGLVLGAEGRGDVLLRLAESAPPTPWVEAGKTLAVGDFAGAADILAKMGSRPEESFARLLEAERLVETGRRPEAEVELSRALAFYRSVGAARFIGQAEALLASTA
jgi:class 3 adenylate cyclase/tetratricopeptide (TPR) repeat protein